MERSNTHANIHCSPGSYHKGGDRLNNSYFCFGISIKKEHQGLPLSFYHTYEEYCHQQSYGGYFQLQKKRSVI